jgi:heptosyltransferase-2
MEALATKGSGAGRVLIRGVNWLGDAVMTTPALMRLREALPQARITLLTQEKLAGLWTGHPAVDQVAVFRKGEGVWAVSRRLRRERFDTALLFPNSPRSALEAWLAGIPRRVGRAGSWRSWLLTEVVPPVAGQVRMRKRTRAEIERLLAANGVRATYPPGAHHIHHYLALGARLGASAEPVAPRLEVGAEEVEETRRRFGLRVGLRWLGLNAGAEYGPAKRWPSERFAEVAREAGAWPGWGVVLFGGPGDVTLARQIEAGVREAARSWTVPLTLLNLAGRTSLRDLCAALKCCDGVVTNDTGPMHLAAALGVPTVALFGSTSPELTGPGLPGDPRHRLLRGPAPCAPCFLRKCPVDFRCLRDLSVEQALAAVLEVAGRPG